MMQERKNRRDNLQLHPTFFCGHVQTTVGDVPTLTTRTGTREQSLSELNPIKTTRAEACQEPTGAAQEHPRPSSGSRPVSRHWSGGLSSGGKVGMKNGCFRRWFMLP